MIITGKKFSKPEMSRVINGDRRMAEDTEKPEKFRLDHLMMERFPEYNRSSLQTFILAGFTKVNGEVVRKANARFEREVKIELNVPEKNIPEDFREPEIIFEDGNVKVLNKPAGLLSMAKGEYCPEPTLEDFGLLVHRLDRDTSGVVILAKNPETQKFLRRQFQERKTHKTYAAVVEGRPKLDEAKIDLPIGRNLKHPTTFQVDPNGKESVTFYQVLKSNEKYSLIELKPVTGRTHQIRVHLKYIGTPILGDKVYGKQGSDDKLSAEQTSAKNRLFLHAKALEITLPGGERRTFSAEIPKEFLGVFKQD